MIPHARDCYRLKGSGPEGSVCILMVNLCGIGDDITALPIVAELAKIAAVTVYTTHPELWKRIQVQIVTVEPDFVTCDNGELLDMLWDNAHLSKYETIYKMPGWGVWDDNSPNPTGRTRFEQLAELLQVSVPKSFDYRAALGVISKAVAPYVVLSVESHSNWRSLPEERAEELFESLLNHDAVIRLTEGPSDANKHHCSSLRELLHLVWNAERVVGIDNGVAHIAGALGIPATLIGGLTGITDIYSQYWLFNPDWQLKAIQMEHSECSSPCQQKPSRGFVNTLCCGSYRSPQCMEAVRVEDVISIAYANEDTAVNGLGELITT